MRRSCSRHSLRCLNTTRDGGTPIPYPVAEALVIALAVYGIAGVCFAVPFAWRGAGAIDPAAEGGTWGFRVFILAGVAALWPFMLVKWRRAKRSSGPGSGQSGSCER